jgi:hypothetical protein
MDKTTAMYNPRYEFRMLRFFCPESQESNVSVQNITMHTFGIEKIKFKLLP